MVMYDHRKYTGNMQATTETPTTMLTAKDADYVAHWPHGIADSQRLGVHMIAIAYRTITGDTLVGIPVEGEAHPQIGALTPTQAVAVATEMRIIGEFHRMDPHVEIWDGNRPTRHLS